MSENVLIHSRDYLKDPYCTVTATTQSTGFPAAQAVNRDIYTAWKSLVAASSALTFYLGPTARSFNRLWFNWNLSSAKVEYGPTAGLGSTWFTSTGCHLSAGYFSGALVSANYVKVSGKPDAGAGSVAIVAGLALCQYLFEFEARDIVGFSPPAFEDAGQKVSRTWHGLAFPSSLSEFAGTVDLDLKYYAEVDAVALRRYRHDWPKVLVVPTPTTHPAWWYQCYWKSCNLPTDKPRCAGRSGTVSFEECV
jgi:hypothetical protein